MGAVTRKSSPPVWLDNCKVEGPEAGEAMAKKEIRFCPYCSMMQFDMAEVEGNVHCEVCGIDVAAEDLIESV